MRAFVVFWLIVFALIFFLYSYPFFDMVYLFAAVYVLSRLWLQRTGGRLQAQRRLVNRAFCGDQVTVELTLRNASWLPIPWIAIRESLPVQLRTPSVFRQVTGLNARQRRDFEYTLHCKRRGYYFIGPLEMETGDVLGTQPPRRKQLTPDTLIVYPKMVPLQKLGLPTHSPLAALPAKAPLFEDPARVIGMRDYQRGDSPRRIHWTATASSGRLLVKQYRPAIARDTLICLDLRPDDYDLEHQHTATELAITTAASLANHIISREKLAVGLVTEAWDMLEEKWTRFSLPPRAERAHLMSLLEALARVQISPMAVKAPLLPVRRRPPTPPFTELLRQETLNMNWGATLAIITGKESLELFDTLVYLRRSGFAVVLILIRSGRPSVTLRRRGDLLGIAIHQIQDEPDLEVRL